MISEGMSSFNIGYLFNFSTFQKMEKCARHLPRGYTHAGTYFIRRAGADLNQVIENSRSKGDALPTEDPHKLEPIIITLSDKIVGVLATWNNPYGRISNINRPFRPKA